MNKRQISKMVKSMVYVVNIVVIITLIWLACTGCNAASGLGRDITNISEAMRKWARTWAVAKDNGMKPGYSRLAIRKNCRVDHTIDAAHFWKLKQERPRTMTTQNLQGKRNAYSAPWARVWTDCWILHNGLPAFFGEWNYETETMPKVPPTYNTPICEENMEA